MEARGVWAAAAGARMVPVSRELLCDGDTPVGVYARLRAFGREEARRSGDPLAGVTFLLESVGGGEHWARYSVVGVGARARILGHIAGDGGLRLTITPGPGFRLPAGVERESAGLRAIECLLAAYAGPAGPELPRFWGGLVGVWGHDMVRAFERVGPPPHPSDLPALDVIASDIVVVFDNFSQRVQVIASACPETEGGIEAATAAAEARIATILEVLRRPPILGARALGAPAPAAAQPAPPYTREGYLAAVARAREHIMAGDIFQVVLSQRFELARRGLDPLEIYRMLRVTNPAPYMVLLELESAALAGASPEVLVRVDGEPAARRVVVRPIAGTRRRGVDRAEDLALEAELLADPKERAEHLMLVDLGRNDVGRVSVAGSVRVAHSFVIERYSRVMHIVSEVHGDLLPGLGALDVLRATFPAGTLSGAPKVRALQIIDDLEPAARGWYGGAVGYLGYDGAADFAICIRSVVLTREHVRVQAGAGIVYDSDPAAEDAECHAKASAVLRAIAMARGDDDDPAGGDDPPAEA